MLKNIFMKENYMKRNPKLVSTISKILLLSDGSKTAKRAAAYTVDLA